MDFVDLDNFQKIEKIGKGSFGEVLKVKDKETGEIYAAKIGFKPLDEETKDAKINLAREVNLLSQLNHPSILKFIGYSPYNFEKKNKPIIITEYSSTGSLFDILELERSGRAPYEWDSTKKLINIYGIANAMSYLHSNNVIHRDLKPQNILENDYLFPKISDFGFSKVYHQNLDSMTIQSTVGFKGTPIYIAPEIWKSNQYTKEGDVYAFSFILYEIVTGEQPFTEYSSFDFAVEVIQSGKRPDFRYEVPEVYCSLIERCWDEDPKNRPTFDQIVTELKENPDFITEEIDQNDFFDYVDYIDQCKKSFDMENKILNIEDILHNRQSNLLKKAVIKKKDQRENSTEKKNSSLKKDLSVESTSQTFYEELTKSECFKKLNQDAQNFFKYVISPDTNKKSITLSRNNLSNLSNSLMLPEFSGCLKLFDQISIELRYPSYNFQKMFDSVKSIKDNGLQQIHVHLLVLSRECNLILGHNRTLNSVTINPSVSKFCDYSFNGCEELKEINIPPSVTRIGEMAFSGCILLEEVKILSSVAYIGKGAFKGCSNLKEITINPLKTTVDFTAFQECPNLHSMILTSDDSTIAPFNEEPFHNITKILVHPSVTTIQENAFKRFTSVKEIIIPSSVTKIEYSAFNGCQSLEKISLPDNITEINDCAFYGCTSLKDIILPSSLKTICSFILFGCTSLTELNLPNTVIQINRYTFANCTSLSRVKMSRNLRRICEAAFKGCTSLEEIQLPFYLRIIDHRAFEGCVKLKTIKYLESYKEKEEEEEEDDDDNNEKMKCYFGEFVFNNCSSLNEADLPKHFAMSSVPVGFFKNCSSLMSFDLDGFYTIDENAFRGCSSLSKIIFPDTVKIIEENAFRDCKSLTEVVIPQFISTLGEFSFMNCTSLEKVSFLSTSLTSIDDHLFEGCTSLKEIDLPESVSTIGKYSFSGCTALTAVGIPESVYSIGKCAFLNCSSLMYLKFPSELKEIGDNCFKGCSLLNIENIKF